MMGVQAKPGPRRRWAGAARRGRGTAVGGPARGPAPGRAAAPLPSRGAEPACGMHGKEGEGGRGLPQEV